MTASVPEKYSAGRVKHVNGMSKTKVDAMQNAYCFGIEDWKAG